MNNPYDPSLHRLRQLSEHEFKRIFKKPLAKYWHPLFGFDIIKFDEEIIKPPTGTSTAQVVKKDYGINALGLINRLLGNCELTKRIFSVARNKT